ncbi:hypothetical protein [Desulfobotulus alkaliphilus]|uniref:hypothetical protein n=1 Tax=Desulfobotulus alkaliphilus TaxID=622671 RepID=UPI0011A9B5E6|nr:hypothetical protein [Desulfobotulus alkaliphilus]
MGSEDWEVGRIKKSDFYNHLAMLYAREIPWQDFALSAGTRIKGGPTKQGHKNPLECVSILSSIKFLSVFKKNIPGAVLVFRVCHNGH